MPRHIQQQPEDDDRNQRDQHVEEDFFRPGSAAIFPVAEFGAICDGYLIGMLEIVGKIARTGISVFRIAIEGAINNLL